MRLPDRAGKNCLLAGPDHHLRRIRDIILVAAIAGGRLFGDFCNPGIGGHGDNRLYRTIVDFLSLFQPVVDSGQHVASLCDSLFLAFDLQFCPASRDIDTKPVFDRNDIAVIFTKQIAQNLRIIKFQIRFDELSSRCGFCFLDHQAASLSLI